MGGTRAGFNLRAQPPIVVLLAGLQGAGKTTTAAKLARWLTEEQRKRVLMVSTDVRRPAAMLQLERLRSQVNAQYYAADVQSPPADIARAALEQARSGVFDVLIVDTAGRLHVDEAMMDEVRQIDQAAHPRGAAVHRRCHGRAGCGERGPGLRRRAGSHRDHLTKADGDARGGAALSVRQVTGKPIVFLGDG